MDELWPVIITAVLGALSSGAVVSWFKDRKKDDAVAELTTVESLQKQVIAQAEINEFLTDEIARLRRDYEESEDSKRKMRIRLLEMEEELETLKRISSRAIQRLQDKCDDLTEQLRTMRGEI